MTVISEKPHRRLLILYYSSLEICGIGTWIEMLSEALSTLGWDVTVGLAWGHHFHNPEKVESARPSLKTIRMDGRTGTEEGRIQAIERTILKVDPDIVMLTCLDSAFEAVRRLRYKGAGFRFIATNHGNLPEQAACLMSHRDIIDMAVCVGRLSHKVMSDTVNGFAEERIRHISHAVPSPKVDCRVSGTKPFRIGYAGRLEDDKRAGDIVPFFREMLQKDTPGELWVAGGGSRETEIRQLADQYPDRVRCFGQLTRNQLYREFFPEIDVLVHFSASEGWGLSIAEAMAHGVVPVTSAFRGIHQEGLVRENENGLVFPVGNLTRAVELVSSLAGNPEELVRLSETARKDIKEKFSPERFAAAWAEALDDCLALPSQPTPSRPVSLDRLGKFGLPERTIEPLRRVLNRQVPHQDIGAEWPHFICRDQTLVKEVAQAMEELS